MLVLKTLFVYVSVTSRLCVHVLAARPDKEFPKAHPENGDDDPALRLWNVREAAVDGLIESLSGVKTAESFFEEKSTQHKEVNAHSAEMESSTNSIPCEQIKADTLIPDCKPPEDAKNDEDPKAVLEKLTKCAGELKHHIDCAKKAHNASFNANDVYEKAFRVASVDMNILRSRKTAQDTLDGDQQKALTHLIGDAEKVHDQISLLPKNARDHPGAINSVGDSSMSEPEKKSLWAWFRSAVFEGYEDIPPKIVCHTLEENGEMEQMGEEVKKKCDDIKAAPDGFDKIPTWEKAVAGGFKNIAPETVCKTLKRNKELVAMPQKSKDICATHGITVDSG